MTSFQPSKANPAGEAPCTALSCLWCWACTTPQPAFALSFCPKTWVSFLTSAMHQDFRARLERRTEVVDTETAGKFEQDKVPALTSKKFIYAKQVEFHLINSQKIEFHPERRTKETHTQLSAERNLPVPTLSFPHRGWDSVSWPEVSQGCWVVLAVTPNPPRPAPGCQHYGCCITTSQLP